mgnify:CR=1 FL=1|uniref:Uncharacterized protein n=1 Tax=viral metagenome TaxID=1070528 RepID=A0A6C0J8H5_9ZZZZ
MLKPTPPKYIFKDEPTLHTKEILFDMKIILKIVKNKAVDFEIECIVYDKKSRRCIDIIPLVCIKKYLPNYVLLNDLINDIKLNELNRRNCRKNLIYGKYVDDTNVYYKCGIGDTIVWTYYSVCDEYLKCVCSSYTSIEFDNFIYKIEFISNIQGVIIDYILSIKIYKNNKFVCLFNVNKLDNLILQNTIVNEIMNNAKLYAINKKNIKLGSIGAHHFSLNQF